MQVCTNVEKEKIIANACLSDWVTSLNCKAYNVDLSELIGWRIQTELFILL